MAVSTSPVSLENVINPDKELLHAISVVIRSIRRSVLNVHSRTTANSCQTLELSALPWLSLKPNTSSGSVVLAVPSER